MLSEKQTANESPQPAGIEQRLWKRTAPDRKRTAVLIARSEQMVAEVIDESFGGIGLCAKDIAGIDIGENVSVLIQGVPVRGVVRWTARTPDGRHRFGIEWLSASRAVSKGSDAAAARAEAEFISLCGMDFACRVVDRNGDGCVRVQLPDASEHEAREAGLRRLTRAQRRKELEALDGDLGMLAGVYQLGDQPSKDEAIRSILDLEYADSWA